MLMFGRILRGSLLCFAACVFGEPDISPVEHLFFSALPLAFASTQAMAVLDNEQSPCVHGFSGCTDFPCERSFELQLSDGCAWPIPAWKGRLPLSVTFSSPGQASIVAVFGDLDLGDSGLFLRQGAVVVVRDEQDLVMALGEQGVSIDSTVQVSQLGWSARIKTNDTAFDLSDDAIIFNGSVQSIEGSSIHQVVLNDVEIDAGCMANPVAGEVGIQAVSDQGGGLTSLSFHRDCDGRADWTSVGTNSLSVREPVPIRLLSP